MSSFIRSWVLFGVMLCALLVGACGSNGGWPDAGATDGGSDTNLFPPSGVLVIQPSTVELDVVDGQPIPTQTFKVTAGGQDVTAGVQWQFGQPEIGDISTGSTFTPTGNVGGVSALGATYQSQSASATITVKIRKTIVSGLTKNQVSALDSPTGGPDPAAHIVYPSDQTFFPQGVLGPEIQWNGAQSGDLYKLDIHAKYYWYTEYFGSVPTPSSHLLIDADWANLTSSTGGAKADPYSVALTRMSGSTAYQPLNQTWHVAQGSLKGILYYWELDGGWGSSSGQLPGRIMSIAPGAGTPSTVFTVPSSWAVTNNACWGCHNISRDGRTMVANFYRAVPTDPEEVVFVTIDLTTTPASAGTITPATNLSGIYGAFNDTGDKLVISNENRNGTTGNASIASIDITDLKGNILAGNVFPTGCGEPAWSPDGKHLAANCELGCTGWSTDCTSAQLWTADVNGSTVTNAQPLVTSYKTGRPYFPSFSPDSKYIAFAQGNGGNIVTSETETQDLWVSDLSGSVVRLDNASGPATTTSDSTGNHTSGNIRFSPLSAGGYWWVVFMSKRDYGNKIVGQHQAQLWISAIDNTPGSTDPSHPAFAVRGQDLTKYNMRAEFALPPCKDLTQSCSSGSDCCGGQCVKGSGGQYTCGMNPGCSAPGNACTTAADCCGGTCIDGYCGTPPIN